MEHDKQQIAIERIRNGGNLFLGGSGGVGKSWTINQVVDQNTLLCAPTGIAALNIGGVTAHKAFKLPIGMVTPKDYRSLPEKVQALFSGNAVRRIIIDEVGMIRADYLDLINHRLQQAKGNNLPFGGIQMVVVGDFFQLEPIVKWEEKEYFQRYYRTPFAFGAKSWEFPTIELTKVYRQDDIRQVKMLNSVRKKDKHHALALQYILEEAKPYQDDHETLHLCNYRNDAAVINDYWYDRTPGTEKVYYANYTGKWNDAPVDVEIPLKEGVHVLIRANAIDGQYCNGDRGTVLELFDDHVVVELLNGRIVEVGATKWEKFGYNKQTNEEGEEEVVREAEDVFQQIPIRLGWAITVHGSQGMTLDDVALDMGRGCFAHGQLYVALSRIKDLKNMSFKRPVGPSDVIVRPEVKGFYKRIEK